MIIKIQHNKTDKTYTLAIDEVETRPMTHKQLYEIMQALNAVNVNSPTLYMDIID